MLNSKDVFLTDDLEMILNKSFEFTINENLNTINIDTLFYLLLENEEIIKMINKNKLFKIEEFKDKLLENLKTEFYQDGDIENLIFVPEITELMMKLRVYQKVSNNKKINVFDFFKILLNFKSKFSIILENDYTIEKYDLEEILLEEIKNYKKELVNKISPNITQEELLENINYIKNNTENKVSQKFLIDLKTEYKQKKLTNVIGREKEIKRILNILTKKENANCLILSDNNIGKTTIINKLLEMIDNKIFNKKIDKLNIFKFDKKTFLNNLKYKHDFEFRINSIIKSLEKETEESIVFIDDMDLLINSFSDIKDALINLFKNNRVKVIATSSIKNYNKIKKEINLETYLTTYTLKELPYEDCMVLLKQLKPTFENFHTKKVGDDVLEYILEVSKKYLKTKLPVSAINLLDESLSTKKNERKSDKILMKDDVDLVLSEMLNLNMNTLKVNSKEHLLVLKEKLKSKIFNQDESINKIVDTIIVNKAGLTKDKKPIASFLLVSSTGTGKTELAKVLANEMSMNLLHYNMSEYVESHSVSKFIGSPSGYVGYEEGGLLVNDVIENPNSVILIDEIEKANKSVMNLFLQILEEAEIQDGRGVKADFRNTIIIMTSNAGFDNSNKLMGFLKDEQQKIVSKVNEIFAKEFINRLDEVLYFNPITKEILEKIIQKNVDEINLLLNKNNNKIIFDDVLITYLIEKGFDKELGARPIYRLIKKEILTLISKEIIFNDAKNKIFNISINSDEKIIIK